jgi:hypothetical protein
MGMKINHAQIIPRRTLKVKMRPNFSESRPSRLIAAYKIKLCEYMNLNLGAFFAASRKKPGFSGVPSGHLRRPDPRGIAGQFPRPLQSGLHGLAATRRVAASPLRGRNPPNNAIPHFLNRELLTRRR